MFLTGKPEDCCTRPEPVREVVLMSTYEELNLIVSISLLIVAILTYAHKK